MEKRKIGGGSDCLKVNPIGLGCMSMSWAYGKPDKKESESLLSAALEMGYDFFDTSDLYGLGHNEELIGRILSPVYSKLTLATKCGILVEDDGKRSYNGHPDYIKQCCEDSLKRLNADVIDLYYLHRPDPNVPIEESVGALADLKKAGKIRAIGLSEVNDELLRRGHSTHPIAALQSEYSLSTRNPEVKILDTCRELGITFIPFSPLGRALQCGVIRNENDIDPKDFRKTLPRFSGENLVDNLALVDQVKDIADRNECTLAQVSLAWLLNLDKTLIPIPGTKHLEYAKENIEAVNVSLSDADMTLLDSIMNHKTVKGGRYPQG